MTVVVTHSTPSDASFSTAGAAAWDASHTLSGVGTMAGQDSNAVAITGGSVDGTTVGATTASTGAFTTLSASSTVSGTGFSTYLASPPAIGGTTAAAGTFTTLIGNSTSQFGKSSVNYLQAVGGATTVAPALTVQSSSDTNVDFSIKALGTGSTLIGTGNGTAIAAADSGATIAWWQFTGTASSTGNMIARVGGGGTNTSLISVAKGTGTIQFATANTATNVQMQVSNTASAVNYVQVTGAATGGSPVVMSAQGSDANVNLTIRPKGSGSYVGFASAGGAGIFLGLPSGSANYFTVASSNAGSSPILASAGADTDISMLLVPKGLGIVLMNQQTPTAVTATGTLTIANLLTQIITSTSATAVSLTLPTGTLSDAGVSGGASAVNTSFNWSIINTGSAVGDVTLVAGTAHTIVGSATVAVGTTGSFRSRKTATNTFVTYRV